MKDDEDSSPTEAFASRWHRRKQATLLKEQSPDRASDQDTLKAPAETLAENTNPVAETTKTDEDMPELTSLRTDDSYSDFLSEGVSKQLRSKALKQLFHLSHFNITDKLDDYDEDFSTFEPLGDTVSNHLKQWLDRDPSNTHQRPENDDAEHLGEVPGTSSEGENAPETEDENQTSPQNNTPAADTAPKDNSSPVQTKAEQEVNSDQPTQNDPQQDQKPPIAKT